jgi:hypothetical protein
MNLFFFNYSHELAMANGHVNYFPPGPVRVMERDLMPLAAWCAGDGGCVVADSSMLDACRNFYARMLPAVRFCDLGTLPPHFNFQPWGWDAHAVWLLRKAGAALPEAGYRVAHVLRLSSREVASRVLNRLVAMLPGLPLCGASHFCRTMAEVSEAAAAYPRSIIKAPLSGSGRGLRFCEGCLVPPLSGWCANVIATQGGVVVEPFLDKLADFAAEFDALPSGEVRFRGFSLFQTTSRCSYVSNTVASQVRLKQLLFAHYEEEIFYLMLPCLQALLEAEISGDYVGPLGVDMMPCATAGGGFPKLQPCVEINLRNTMGIMSLHLARILSPGVVAKLFIHYENRPSDLRQFVSALPPAVFDGEGRLLRGALPLTPVTEATCYAAYLQVDGSE